MCSNVSMVTEAIMLSSYVSMVTVKECTNLHSRIVNFKLLKDSESLFVQF